MSICRRCHRQLKREPWQSLGIGKICSQKENIERAKIDNGDSDIIVPYDGGDIWIERLEPDRKTTSTLRTNIQRTIYRHSPTGFNYGYGGSGPADTALNILLMFTDKETAQHCYQEFKWRFLGEDCDRLVIPKGYIESFITEQKVLADA